MSEDARQFESLYARKGRGTLDRIFGEFTPERSRVRLASPRHAREVVFIVDYEDRAQYENALNTLCEWLKEKGDFEELRELMLH